MPASKNILKRILLLLTLLLLVLIVVWFTLDKTSPKLSILPQPGFASKDTVFTLLARDEGAGLAETSVVVKQDGKIIPVLEHVFGTSDDEWKGTFRLNKEELTDGPLTIIATALDASNARWGSGNTATTELSLVLDTKKPQIVIKNATRYVKQGGSGTVCYTLSEGVSSTGVKIGEEFFPGYEQSSNTYFCLYSYPYYLDDLDVQPVLLSKDVAGNTARTGVPVTITSGGFKKDRITISDTFLQQKMVEYAEGNATSLETLYQTFRKVNKDVRSKDNEKIAQVGAISSPQMDWTGTFLRLPNAARKAGFGDFRTYYYNNEQVGESYHLGIDLASLANAPVPAANTGTVVFADMLGIYGNTIIIDHGTGLQSLYAHLHEFRVQVGDKVQKGDTIALTGQTGMALGDHLHFGILVSGIPVNPVEWWDKKWIQTRIINCSN